MVGERLVARYMNLVTLRHFASRRNNFFFFVIMLQFCFQNQAESGTSFEMGPLCGFIFFSVLLPYYIIGFSLEYSLIIHLY